jgi:hypothetical protein
LPNGNFEFIRNLEKNTFIEILNNKKEVDHKSTLDLKAVIDKYPYFQAARALYLKGLKNQDSFKYNKELKNTAAYTTDRTILFEYITSNDFSKKEIIKELDSIQPNIEEKPISKIIKAKEKQAKTEVQETKETLSIGKPIQFSASENFSFNQWLQLSVKKPIIREVKKEKLIDKKQEIINQFIENNPKIEPVSKDKVIPISIPETKQDNALMTETLAKVYLEQKKYKNAIQAYRILSLKYPEKSGFFADQIKRIEILQKHKS